MTKDDIKSEIQKAQILYKKQNNKNVILQAEEKIEKYLNNNPFDTDIWLLFAMFEYQIPVKDTNKSIECLKNILKYDPSNSTAILLLAAFYNNEFGYIDDDLFTRLNTIKNQNNEIMSMIELAKSWHYGSLLKNNYVAQEESLIKSINLCPYCVRNYINLANLYLEQGKINKGKELLKKAINNIKNVYFENYDPLNINDIEEFFNTYFKGTHTTRPALNLLIKKLNE